MQEGFVLKLRDKLILKSNLRKALGIQEMD